MATVTLRPTADTYISGGSQTTNFGTSGILRTGVATPGKSSQLLRSLLRFSLASLLNAESIDAAALTLFIYSNNAPSATFGVHRITQPAWTELGATYLKYDGVTNWSSAGGDFDATPWQFGVAPGEFDTSLTFDSLVSAVTDAIQNRGGVLDLLLKGSVTTGTDYVDFYSREDTDIELRPALVVTYTSALVIRRTIGLGLGIEL
jgi:hypothetical protein